MQTRLLACIAGGFLGVVAAISLNERVDISPFVTFGGCAIAGIGLGYAVSMMVDIFTADATQD